MITRFSVLMAALCAIVPQQLSAQGIFEGFSFPSKVIATGHTELVAPIVLTLRAGSTASDTLIINVSPLRITNSNAADIRVVSGGSIAVGATVLEPEAGVVRIPVQAGGSSGAIRVDGIRVSALQAGGSAVTARVSFQRSMNLLRAANSNVVTASISVPVFSGVESGLAVDPMTDRFVIYNGVVYDSTGAIVVREGFESAFTDSTDFGQNTPTQIRIRLTDLPSGLQFRFPATVTAEEGATLTTVEGAAVDLPRANGTANLVYNFNSTADSLTEIESFEIPFTVSANELVATLQPTIEVSLAPIGAAEPTADLPSTSIPRFAEENIAVLEGASKIITKTLYWIGIDAVRENRISAINPSSRAANLTFTAFNAAGQAISGANITNPVEQTLSANQGSDQSLTQIFGVGASNVASVRVQSTGSEVIAIGTSESSGLLESIPLLSRATAAFVIPAADANPRLHIFNPNPVRVSGTVILSTTQGGVVGTGTIGVDPMATVSRPIAEIFSLAMRGSGYVSATFDASVIASESSGTANTLEFLAAQPPAGVGALYVPFFATGGGYETDLNIINSANQTVTLNARVYDTQGAAAAGNGRLITLLPSEELATTVSSLFDLQSATSGYIRIEVPELRLGPWSYYPAITGHARIREGQNASTLIPLSGFPLQDSFLLSSGTSSGQFQGIALVNPNSFEVNVTLQALNANGTTVGTATRTLAPGQVSATLLNGIFTVAVAERSVIRVTASAPVVVTSITGASGQSLRYVPALK